MQAEEFVGKVSEDRLQSVIQQAALKCPECTLCLMVDGLEHYLTLRQRREFQVKALPCSPIELPHKASTQQNDHFIWAESGERVDILAASGVR